MSRAAMLQRLLDQIHALLADAAEPNAAAFARRLPQAAQPLRGLAASHLPVLDWLAALELQRASDFSNKLLSQLVRLGPKLAWSQSYSRSQVGSHFLDNYGWSEIVGPRGHVAGSGVVCGFLLLGPDTDYPAHAHEPAELYVPLTGGSRWQKGQSGWVTQPAGALIHHPPWVSHAMHTRDNPLAALYLWQGEDFTNAPVWRGPNA